MPKEMPEKCPKCGSTNIYCRVPYFKTAQTRCVCLECGYRWVPGPVEEAFEGKKKEIENATKKRNE